MDAVIFPCVLFIEGLVFTKQHQLTVSEHNRSYILLTEALHVSIWWVPSCSDSGTQHLPFCGFSIPQSLSWTETDREGKWRIVEVGYLTSIHISLAGSYSKGHTLLQGRLGNVVRYVPKKKMDGVRQAHSSHVRLWEVYTGWGTNKRMVVST